MKERHGFMSNSSTSSFILVGTKVTSKQTKQLESKYDVESAWDIKFKGDIKYLCDDDESFLGKIIFDGNTNEETLPSVEIDQEEFKKVKTQIEKIIGEEVIVKVYAGTRSC